MKFEDKYPEVARPYVACFVILRRGNGVAMVLRKNTGYMDGYYGLPAGKGEWFETFSTCAIREAKEEAGVDISEKDLKFVHVVHRHGEDLHSKKFMDWVDVYFEADRWEGEPHNAEEHKSERLDWLYLDNLPENIVPPQAAALQHIAKGEMHSTFGWN
ncbi:NUDIX domain-containing protein [Candidatus Saccharibacteria bacterium]|nr:NUDIX domain-containing protein [Candidatus Saccharibacteria bacterium]